MRGWSGRLAIWCMLVGLTAAAVVVLRELPYSTSWVIRVDESELLAAPGDRFSVGPLSWDLRSYQSAPELQAFRDTFATHCAGMSGLQAARCVTDIFNAASPRGEPRVEFFAAEFDPAATLREHMAGAPGHCTARSAMTTTALLSMGVPSRVVQVLPRNDFGHNLVEVWDAEHGWLIFDPFFDSSFLLGDSFLSAVKLSEITGGLRWRRPNSAQVDPNRFAGSTINYPEPWLYTRVGDRCAVPPFRGCFAQVGPRQFSLGTAQRLAAGCALVFGLASVFWTLQLWSLRRTRLSEKK